MTLEDIFDAVSSDLELPKSFVNKVYRAYWRAVRDYIVALPLKDDLTDEEFLALRPNVNVPSLGKLYVTLEKYRRERKLYEIVKSKRAEKQEYDTH